MTKSLLAFPPEILAQILAFDNLAPASLNLWKCGNRDITERLAHDVTHVSLEKAVTGPPSLPQALFQFRNLRSLTLKCHQYLLKDPTEWPKMVSSLPETLETIYIRSKDARLAFLNFAPDWTARSPRYIETQYTRSPSTLIDIERRFPRLTTLKLLGFSDLHQLSGPELLCGLPPYLTTLGYLVGIQLDPQQLSTLPPSLVRLEASLIINFEGGLPPPSMLEWASNSRLEWISGLSVNQGAATDMSWLPQSLLHCTFPEHTLTPEFLGSLPPKIESIAVEKLNEEAFRAKGLDWMAHLPAALKSVKFTIPPSLSTGIGLLPQTLTSMSSVNFGASFSDQSSLMASNKKEIVALWPPTLRSMIFERLHQQVDLSFLPRSLQSLTFVEAPSTSRSQVSIDTKIFPPKLTTLHIEHPDTFCQYRGDQFPRHLTSLTIIEVLGEKYGIPSGLNRSSFETFPDSLTALNVTMDLPYFENAAQGPPRLPKHLESLSLNIWHREWTKLLPRSITALTIKQLHGSSKVTQSMTTDFLNQLPQGLVKLHVGKFGPPVVILRGFSPHDLLGHAHDEAKDKTSVVNFTDDCFAHLTHLRDLSIRFGLFSSAALRSLPRDMKNLEIVLEKLDAEDAPFIPPHLKYMQLGPHIDTKAEFLGQHWPLGVLPAVTSKAFMILRKRLIAAGLPWAV